MVQTDCDRDYGIPSYPPCSGNGICITNKCICNKGWSSLADLQGKTGVDCDIHLQTILGLASTNLSIACIGVILCLIALCHAGIKKTNKSYNKQIKIISFLLSISGSVVMTSLRVIDAETYRLGYSYGASIGFFSNIVGVCFGYTYFIQEIVFLLQRSCTFMDEESSETITLYLKLHLYNRYSFILPYLAFPPAIFLIATHINPNRSDYYAIGLLGTLLIILIAYCLAVLSILPIFITEMIRMIAVRPDAIESMKIKQLHPKLTIVNVLFKILLVTTFPTFIAFMAWGYLRRKYSYFLCFCEIVTSICTSILAFSFIPTGAISRSRRVVYANPHR